MPVARPLTLLVNPTAAGGRSARVLVAVQRRLTDRGAEHRTVATRDAEHAAEATREALDRGDVAVAVGGDGMLRIVAEVAADRPDASVGVVPAGRGNDFARFLGLPVDPEAAADVLLDGEAVAIDTGRAHSDDGQIRTFLSIGSCGFDSEANRIANEAPSWLGGLVYVWGVFGALARLRPIRFDVTLDGESFEHRGISVGVANGGIYGGGMRIAPDASVADGRFDVVLIAHRGRRVDRCDWRDRLRLVRFLPRVFRGTHLSVDAVEVRRATTVRLSADRPLPVYADGDPIGTLPITLSTAPASLRLLLPVGHRSAGLRPAPSVPEAAVTSSPPESRNR